MRKGEDNFVEIKKAAISSAENAEAPAKRP